MTQIDLSHNLQELMQRVNISSFKSLSRVSGVSERQILRLRQGKVAQMRLDTLIKLSTVLQISVSELIAVFLNLDVLSDITSSIDSDTLLVSEPVEFPINDNTQSLEILQKEYQEVLLKMSQQREFLWQEFQLSSLYLLESFLLQWPKAAQRAQENPQLPAINIVPLVQKSIEKLLQAWGITEIAPVGREVTYDPQLHQLTNGNVQVGEIVKVYYPGYLQGNKLLYRAHVIPIPGGR